MVCVVLLVKKGKEFRKSLKENEGIRDNKFIIIVLGLLGVLIEFIYREYLVKCWVYWERLIYGSIEGVEVDGCY